MDTKADLLGRQGIDLIMQGRYKDGLALALEATKLENEERREAYRRFWSKVMDGHHGENPEE